MNNKTCAAMVAACLFVLPGSAFGQELRISGTLRDPQAVAISDVAVTLKDAAGVKSQVSSDSSGQYRFGGLKAGQYELSFQQSNFQAVDRTVQMTTEDQVVDLTLALASTSSSVDVIAVAGKATASRMDVSNLELPVAVSSIPQWVLEEQGINDMRTALQNASGVASARYYGTTDHYTIRGFNQAELVLVDGMRLEGDRISTQLNNVESVEVLKGPSSILYGGQALGGAINIIRKKPQKDSAFDIFYRYGRFNTNLVGGSAAGSVFGASNLWYRVDGSYQYSDAWRSAKTRQLNISPSLTWMMKERTRLTIMQGFTNDRYATDAGVPVGLIAADPNFDPSVRFNTVQDRQLSKDWQSQVLFETQINDHLQLRNGLAYRRFNYPYRASEVLTYQPAQNQVARTAYLSDNHVRPIQDQLDLLAKGRFLKLQHSAILGYEYQDFYGFSNSCAVCSVAVAPINLTTLVDPFVPRTSFPISSRNNFSNRINAFYWQDLISLTEHLTVNVGGRFDSYRRASHNDPFANDVASSRTVDTVLKQSAYTYRIGAVYALPRSNQIYASSNSSFEPVTSVPLNGSALVPQTGRSYEVGHRMQLFGGRLTFSTAAYRMLRQNVVIGLGSGRFDQAGQQSSKGLEEDITGDIGHGIRVVANYGYAQPLYDNYFASNGTVNLSGRMPASTQRHAANVWVTKVWNSGWTGSLGARYLSKRFADNTNLYPLAAYTIMSARVGYRHGRYEYDLNIENLLNKRNYYLAAIYNTQVYPGAPINLFATVRYRFH